MFTSEDSDCSYNCLSGNCVEREDLAVVVGRSRFLFDAMLGLSHQYGKSMNPRRRSPSVVSWAVGLDKVLEDPVGLNTFKEFLKREFSAENITFWIACEHYRKDFDLHQRKKLAKDIVDHHLCPGAPEAINIDSHTRHKSIEGMHEARQDLFIPAQKQIFNLMKFDCYQRFLKSDLFTCSLTAEKLGKPLPFQDPTGCKSPKKYRSRSKSRDRNRILHAKLHLNLSYGINSSNENTPSPVYSDENNANSGENSPKDELDEKKRKSLLPWQKGRAKSTEPERSNSRSPVLRERSSNFRRSKRKTVEKKHHSDREKTSTRSSANTLDISAKRLSFEEKYGQHLLPPQSCDDHGNYRRLLSTETSGTTPISNEESNKSVSDVVTRAKIVKHGVSKPGLDAPTTDAMRIDDLTPPLSVVPGKEMLTEHRTIFRLELPSQKVIAVRAVPVQTCYEVLEPVLRKYGLNISDVLLYFDGSTIPLNVNGGIQLADRCKICVRFKDTAKDVEIPNAALTQMKKSKKERKDVTSRVLEEIVKGTICFYYDELGILDLENGDVRQVNRPTPTERSSAGIDAPRRNSFTTCKDDKSKPRSLYSNRASIHEGMGIKIELNEITMPQENANTTPRRSISKNVHYRDSCDFTGVWNRAQKQLDDQRGLELNCELPEFLRLRSDSSPAKLPGTHSQKP